MIFRPSDMNSVPAFDQLKLLEPRCSWRRHWPASLLSSTANQLKIPKASLYWIQNTNPSFSVTGVFKAATFVPILSLLDWRGYMWKCVWAFIMLSKFTCMFASSLASALSLSAQAPGSSHRPRLLPLPLCQYKVWSSLNLILSHSLISGAKLTIFKSASPGLLQQLQVRFKIFSAVCFILKLHFISLFSCHRRMVTHTH